MEEIRIDRQEVLRYLGYHGQKMTEADERRIDDCIAAMERGAKPRFIYRIFDIAQDFAREEIRILETNMIFRGRDIYEHLRSCKKCAVLAATLGIEADNMIRIAQRTDMTRAVILDACAGDMIEKVCDAAEREIEAVAAKEKKGLNFRFSPGYGDFPLETQKEITAALETGKKIGLTLTENSLMIPRKSVTAVVGFTFQIGKKKNTDRCSTCSMQGQCRFRREGRTCGR